MDELQALSYFSSLTHISRKIALQEKSLIKYLGNKWTEYSPEEKEEILDDLCVPHFIRDEQPPVADDEDGIGRPVSCWPTLKLPSGEKIIVDENDVRGFCFFCTLEVQLWNFIISLYRLQGLFSIFSLQPVNKFVVIF